MCKKLVEAGFEEADREGEQYEACQYSSRPKTSFAQYEGRQQRQVKAQAKPAKPLKTPRIRSFLS